MDVLNSTYAIAGSRSGLLGSDRPRSSLEVEHVRTIDPEMDPRWEAFVKSHPNGLVYHHPAWIKVLEQENGDRPICLAYEDAHGRLRGILPLFVTRGLPLWGRRQTVGRRLSSLPRTPIAGPLASDSEVTAALLRAAVQQLHRHPDAVLQLKVPSHELNGLVDGLVGAPWRPTYVLEIPERPEDLHYWDARNHSRIHWAVNKAQKFGLLVRRAETERDLQAWYALYADTMRWHAIPPRPYRFFSAAWKLLMPRGLMRLLLAEVHEARTTKLLAGAIFFMFGRTVFYSFSGMTRESLPLRPNDALQWQSIQDSCKEGFRYYDLGEVPANHWSLAKFKSKWGAEQKWLYRYFYPAPVEFESGDLAFGRGVRLAKNAWRTIPLKATILFGDWLYRRL